MKTYEYTRDEIKSLLPRYKNAYITRMNYKNCNGWWVRITVPKSGVVEKKFFGVKQYGTVKKAHIAALAYRDEKVLQYRAVPCKLTGKRVPTLHSRTPVDQNMGVNIGAKLNATNGLVYCAWAAHHGLRNNKKAYAILKYGYRQAFYLACKHREKLTGIKVKYTEPPSREIMATYLKSRFGPDWKHILVPAWEKWWR